uniref:hypothetical protein n=1 Tax=Streptomyces sp. WSLK1-5 TaxID=3375473 RepID=UPI0037D9DFDF
MRYATIRNFTSPDVLNADDGLPASPESPLRYGAPTLAVDDQGNGIEEHTPSISYFDEKYYKYAEKQACGTLAFFSGTIPGLPKPTPYPAGDYGGQCGIGMYSSTGLTTWHSEGVFQPPLGGKQIRTPKPQVEWSPGLHQYVIYFMVNSSNPSTTGGLYYARSDTPVGPWSDIRQVADDHLAHDYDITTGPDGNAYIVTDTFSGTFDNTKGNGSHPLWDFGCSSSTPT